MKTWISVLLTVAMLFGACALADYRAGEAARDIGNYELAAELWEKAAAQGDMEAAFGLGMLYYKVDYGLHDYDKAIEWLEKAKDAGWLEKAAEMGNVEALEYLGTIYEIGNGVEKDKEMARAYYQRAILLGSTYAVEKLVWMDENLELKFEYIPSLDEEGPVWYEGDYKFVTYDGGTAHVVGYTRSIDPEEDGNVTFTIPSEFLGYRVVEIADYAFEGCGATEYIVPEGVERIGKYAFHGSCAVSVKLPKGLETIDEGAFLRAVYLQEINIPDEVTYIGDEAFGYTSLKEITLPETELALGANPFANCEELKKINFSENHPVLMRYDTDQILKRSSQNLFCIVPWVEWDEYLVNFSPETRAIEDRAFKGFIGLYELNVPGSVKTIGDYAFFESTVTHVNLAEGVESIGECAFDLCPSLSEVRIPATVTFIGEDAFGYRNDSVLLKVKPGSYAEQYAKENQLRYVTE